MAKAQKSRSKSRSKHHHRAKLKAPGYTEGLQVVHTKAAGIDVGNEEHWVAAAPDLDPARSRALDSCTQDLQGMANWLVRIEPIRWPIGSAERSESDGEPAGANRLPHAEIWRATPATILFGGWVSGEPALASAARFGGHPQPG
jgi:hypothetical protein